METTALNRALRLNVGLHSFALADDFNSKVIPALTPKPIKRLTHMSAGARDRPPPAHTGPGRDADFAAEGGAERCTQRGRAAGEEKLDPLQ